MHDRVKGAGNQLPPGDPNQVKHEHPADTRIKRGEVRNPWGRSGKPRAGVDLLDFMAQLQKRLLQPIRSSDGRDYSFPDVIANTLVKRVSQGDMQAVKLSLELCQQASKISGPAPDRVVDAERRKLLIEEALARQAAKKRRPQTTGSSTGKDQEREGPSPDVTPQPPRV